MSQNVMLTLTAVVTSNLAEEYRLEEMEDVNTRGDRKV
jgi:hypothetical protein